MHMLIYLSLAPVIVLIILFYSLDKYEPEPKSLLLKVFGFGVLSVIPVAIAESSFTHFYPDPYRPDNLKVMFITIFLSIALIEELAKFLVVMLGIYRSPEFDEPYDGIIYTVSASLGFAALENACYVIVGGLGVGLLRAVLSVPAHALFGVLMGYFIGRAKFSSPFGRVMLLLAGFMAAALAHTVFDFLIFSRRIDLMLCLIPHMGLLWILAFFFVKSAQAHSYFKYNPQKEDSPAGSDRRCSQCGYSMPEDSNFCSHCGTEVIPQRNQELCPRCGYSGNPAGSRFCISCGAPIGAGKP